MAGDAVQDDETTLEWLRAERDRQVELRDRRFRRNDERFEQLEKRVGQIEQLLRRIDARLAIAAGALAADLPGSADGGLVGGDQRVLQLDRERRV